MIYVVNKSTFENNPSFSTFYIGRGGPLGNPYSFIKNKKTLAEFSCESREESIELYKLWLDDKIKKRDVEICDYLNRIYKAAKSGDVYLLCFCDPKPCHGNYIKSIIKEKIKS